MRFVEAVYGSPCEEIRQRGGDPAKGRLNGNLFLSAFVFLGVVALFLLALTLIPGSEEKFSGWTRSIFGGLGGRSVGKILAIPVFGIIYFVIANTTGSAASYQKHTEAFLQYPEAERKKANRILLLPFFVLLLLVVILTVTGIS